MTELLRPRNIESGVWMKMLIMRCERKGGLEWNADTVVRETCDNTFRRKSLTQCYRFAVYSHITREKEGLSVYAEQ